MPVNLLPGVRATKEQRRVLTNYLSNGGDKFAAYMAVFGDKKPDSISEHKLRIHARAYFKRPTMTALMQEADIEARVQIEKRALTDQHNAIVEHSITKERILSELAKIAFAQQTDVMSWGPDGIVVKDSKDIGDAGAAVGEVVQTGGGESPIVMKVKLLDKQQALQALGKELYGMFTQKVDVRGTVGVAVGAKFILEGKD